MRAGSRMYGSGIGVRPYTFEVEENFKYVRPDPNV